MSVMWLFGCVFAKFVDNKEYMQYNITVEFIFRRIFGEIENII